MHKTMSFQEVDRVVQNLSQNEVLDIVITGGEPLVRPDLTIYLIDQAQASGIECSLNTNLTLLTDDIAEQIAQRGVPVLTSFPSFDPAIFDAIVCDNGAHARAVKGIHTALSHDIVLSANMVVMKKNAEHVLQTGRFVHSLGINSFSATKVHPSQSCKDFGGMQLTREQVIDVFKSLKQLKNELGMSVDSLTSHAFCLFDDITDPSEIIVKRSCAAGKISGVIGSDGGVRACTHADEIHGNAFSESLGDIWPRLSMWRDGSYIPDECHSCKFIGPCGGGCRMDAKFFSQNKKFMDPYACAQRAENLTFPETAKEHEISVEMDTPIRLHPLMQLRDEKFGVVVKGDNGMRIVTQESGDVLRLLLDRRFTVRSIVKKHGFEPFEALNFIQGLVDADLATVETVVRPTQGMMLAKPTDAIPG